METNHLTELIEESIRLELNISELYKLFAETHPEDNEFWWQLHLEEKSHATLIRAARDSFIKRGKFPFNLVTDSISTLQESNLKVRKLIECFQQNPPGRTEACHTAIDLEQEVGEVHYTQFMEKKAENVVETVFQQLNRDDKDHEDRIRAYLNSICSTQA
ncbi:hypothetical protein P4B35_06800 [Pontiellaceae bacterium B12227]|nr:hypothetical protein [Pontiellaceae bacterium B12227]